ncbi:MAG: hypothetical protein ACLVB5_05800 [Christensenellales bacterium]
MMTLIVGGAALAANLGVFGQSVNNDDNEQSVGRLEKLEDVSATYNDTQAVTAPSQSATEAPKTTRDELMASLYNRRFNLTLNQAYFDGYKLYYSYTLTSDCKTGFITGEGMPTGFDEDGDDARRRASSPAASTPLRRRHAAGDRDVFLRPPRRLHRL